MIMRLFVFQLGSCWTWFPTRSIRKVIAVREYPFFRLLHVIQLALQLVLFWEKPDIRRAKGVWTWRHGKNNARSQRLHIWGEYRLNLPIFDPKFFCITSSVHLETYVKQGSLSRDWKAERFRTQAFWTSSIGWLALFSSGTYFVKPAHVLYSQVLQSTVICYCFLCICTIVS